MARSMASRKPRMAPKRPSRNQLPRRRSRAPRWTRLVRDRSSSCPPLRSVSSGPMVRGTRRAIPRRACWTTSGRTARRRGPAGDWLSPEPSRTAPSWLHIPAPASGSSDRRSAKADRQGIDKELTQPCVTCSSVFSSSRCSSSAAHSSPTRPTRPACRPPSRRSRPALRHGTVVTPVAPAPYPYYAWGWGWHGGWGIFGFFFFLFFLFLVFGLIRAIFWRGRGWGGYGGYGGYWQVGRPGQTTATTTTAAGTSRRSTTGIARPTASRRRDPTRGPGPARGQVRAGLTGTTQQERPPGHPGGRIRVARMRP